MQTNFKIFENCVGFSTSRSERVKGVKNGYKVKKDILSAQDILLALFGRGRGFFSPFGAI